MQKQANRNRRPTEAPHYYAGTISLDGVPTRVLFTEKELNRPKERARKQPEEFAEEPRKGSPVLGIFSIVKKILSK